MSGPLIFVIHLIILIYLIHTKLHNLHEPLIIYFKFF